MLFTTSSTLFTMHGNFASCSPYVIDATMMYSVGIFQNLKGVDLGGQCRHNKALHDFAKGVLGVLFFPLTGICRHVEDVKLEMGQPTWGSDPLNMLGIAYIYYKCGIDVVHIEISNCTMPRQHACKIYGSWTKQHIYQHDELLITCVNSPTQDTCVCARLHICTCALAPTAATWRLEHVNKMMYTIQSLAHSTVPLLRKGRELVPARR